MRRPVMRCRYDPRIREQTVLTDFTRFVDDGDLPRGFALAVSDVSFTVAELMAQLAFIRRKEEG
ncbi:MAG: hypothetical protein ABR529_15815 [Actinomycetota bacterium]